MKDLDSITADWAKKQVTENLRSAHNVQLKVILLRIKTMVDNGNSASTYNFQKESMIGTVRAELVKRGFVVTKTDISDHRNETNYSTNIKW
jgi:hypothetical protein